MRAIQFFKESIRNIQSVGTVTQSSKHLCKTIIKQLDLQDAKLLIELGAGDGVITKFLLDEMPQDCKLLAFEINERFLDQLNSIQDDRLIIVDESAEYIAKHVQANGFGHVDHVISALPFTLMPNNLTKTIVENCKTNLRAQGSFVQVHYSLSQRKLYKKIFGNLDINFVPLNIPPAFVMVSEKNGL